MFAISDPTAPPTLSPSVPTDPPETFDWSIVSAISSVVLAVVALAALIAALLTWKTARDANRQAKEDSIARTRPYVFVEIVSSQGSTWGSDIHIKNSGQSSAVDLRLEFDNWPSALDSVGSAVGELFATRRTLPPGCSIRSYWSMQVGGPADTRPADVEPDTDDVQGLPHSGVVTAMYRSQAEDSPLYKESFEILTLQSGLIPVGYKGADVPNPGLKHFYKLGQQALARLSEMSRR